jgi:hypothetical protein
MRTAHCGIWPLKPWDRTIVLSVTTATRPKDRIVIACAVTVQSQNTASEGQWKMRIYEGDINHDIFGSACRCSPARTKLGMASIPKF